VRCDRTGILDHNLYWIRTIAYSSYDSRCKLVSQPLRNRIVPVVTTERIYTNTLIKYFNHRAFVSSCSRAVYTLFTLAPSLHTVLAPFSPLRVELATGVDSVVGRSIAIDFQPPWLLRIHVLVSVLPSRHEIFAAGTPTVLQRLAEGQYVDVANAAASFSPRHNRVVVPLPLPGVDDVIFCRQDGVTESRQELI